MQNTYTMHSFVGLLAPKITHTTFTMSLFIVIEAYEAIVDVFRKRLRIQALDLGLGADVVNLRNFSELFSDARFSALQAS